MPQATQNALTSMLVKDVVDPTSRRFASSLERGWEWLNRAEALLSTLAVFPARDDYSTLLTFFGWAENASGCTSGGLCDEAFVIHPIAKESPIYLASMYSPGASHIAIHTKKGGYRMNGEVIAPGGVDGVSGTLLIKWRDGTFEPGGAVDPQTTPYQTVSYLLNPGNKLLKMRWGSPAGHSNGAGTPAVPTDADACDGATLTCHDLNYDQGIHR